MEEEYDVIALGTGLKECILSGLMSVDKKKVLHMDRNGYYGGESASLNLEQLFKKFKGDAVPPKELGRTRDYSVDLCPKYLMACGNLVKVLLRTNVTKYLEFKSVAGSYFTKDSKIYKVPSTPKEALDTPLSLAAKMRYKGFLEWVSQYDIKDPKTHVCGTIFKDTLDLTKWTSRKLFEYFKLDEETIDFTGHAIALYQSDDYLDKPALDMVERCKLYALSVSRYGNSPYIYPIWGLGGLPEGFSRLCAINKGTYMLNKPVEAILYDKDGKVRGVKSEGQEAYCKQLIADPSYFLGTDKIKKSGQIARAIAITNHPIAGSNADSAQIILPAKSIGDGKKRTRDVYVCMVSSHHKVCAAGKYVCVISAEVEGKEIPSRESDSKACEAACKRELEAALQLIGATEELFFWVSDSYAAANDSKKDNIFITSTYDATTHFESATNEVLRIYKELTGHDLDLTPPPEDKPEEGEEVPEGKEEAEAPASEAPASAPSS